MPKKFDQDIEKLQKYLQHSYVPTQEEIQSFNDILKKERFEKISNELIIQLNQENEFALTLYLYSIFNCSLDEETNLRYVNLNIDKFIKLVSINTDNRTIKKYREKIIQVLNDFTVEKNGRKPLIKELINLDYENQAFYSYRLIQNPVNNGFTIMHHSEFNYLINKEVLKDILKIREVNVFRLINIYTYIKITLNLADNVSESKYKIILLKKIYQVTKINIANIRFYLCVLMLMGLIEKDMLSDTTNRNYYQLSTIWIYYIKAHKLNLLKPSA